MSLSNCAERGKLFSLNMVFTLTGILLLSSLTHEASLQTQNTEKETRKFISSKTPELQLVKTIKKSSTSTSPFQLVSTLSPQRREIQQPTKASGTLSFRFNPSDQFPSESRGMNGVIRSTRTPDFVAENKGSKLNDGTSSEDLYQNFFGEESSDETSDRLSSKPPSTLSYSLSYKLPIFTSASPPPPPSSSSSPPAENNGNDLSTSQAPREEINEEGKASLSADKRNTNPKEEVGGKMKSHSERKYHKSKSKRAFETREDRTNDLVETVNKKEVHKEILNPYKDNPESDLPPRKVNNKLEDPFLLSVAKILNKNVTQRISEIVSLKNKPEKFIAMLKVAKQSENFEDPFSMSTILHESSLDNILAADSSAFNEGLKKLHQSSFRDISNEPKQYKLRKEERNKNKSSSETLIKNEETITFQDKPLVIKKENTSSRMPLDSDVLEVGNKFKESYANISNETKEFSKENLEIPSKNIGKIIYEEISGNLHIDTSIDDIKDAYESHEKTTEISDQYLPSINTSRVNFLEPELRRVKLRESLFNVNHLNLSSNANISSSNLNSSTKEHAISSGFSVRPNTTDLQNNTNISTVNLSNAEMTPYLSFNKSFPNNTDQTSESLWSNESSNAMEDTTSTTVASITRTSTNVIRSSLVKGSDAPSVAPNTEEGGDIQVDERKENTVTREKDVNRYYSFFGYKEKLDLSSKQESKSQMSVTDHNEKILAAQAERMLQVMNSSADPCEDFYEYACGKWSQVYPLEDKALDNTFDRLREGLDEVLKLLLEEPITDEDTNATRVAKTLYRGCMNEEQIEIMGVAPLKTLLRELGGWPVIEDAAWNETAFDWVELMAKLRNYNNDILLSEWVAADITNSSNHIIQLDQPELGLPGREYFISAGDQTYRMAYMELMLKTCQLLGANPQRALEDMINVLQFEKQLAKILTPAEERRNLSAVHRRLTVEELQKKIPQIAWNKYFEMITGSSGNSERFVIVFAMKYIHKLVRLIETATKRTVSNYLMWRFVKNRMNNLGKNALGAKQEFVQVLFGSKSQPERWLSCVSYVNGNLGYVLGALFVKRYYPQSSKNDSEEMIRLIRETFTETVQSADWMEEQTRKVAEKKVYAMVRNVGYPEYILNSTSMDLVYSKLNFNESDHFWNVIKMLQFHARSSHDLLRKPVNRTEWTTTPAVVNAYYSRSKNMIMFPAGILQPPFYHPAFPRCLNFGGIGVVIGHEISHGFDDRGRQFDEHGNLHQWWTSDDVSHFYDRATCMLDQYSNYKVESVGLKINAVNTLGENIADNVGLKIAYKAYQQWKKLNGGERIQMTKFNLTHDQLFFLNFGQIWCEVNSPEAMLTKIRGGQHSPNKYRVIGTLSNSKEFSEAFKCREGSLMNPEEKCQVW